MNFTDVTEAYLSTMPPPDEFVRESMESHQSSMEEARELYLMHTEPEFRVYEGDAHRVTVWPVGGELGHSFVRLSIQNTDGSARHDWRELQQIKNEVVGQENEAIELYPAESRKRGLWQCVPPVRRQVAGLQVPVWCDGSAGQQQAANWVRPASAA